MVALSRHMQHISSAISQAKRLGADLDQRLFSVDLTVFSNFGYESRAIRWEISLNVYEVLPRSCSSRHRFSIQISTGKRACHVSALPPVQLFALSSMAFFISVGCTASTKYVWPPQRISDTHSGKESVYVSLCVSDNDDVARCQSEGVYVCAQRARRTHRHFTHGQNEATFDATFRALFLCQIYDKHIYANMTQKEIRTKSTEVK